MKITDETLNKIEKVFGFELYDWQKKYIKGETDIRAGGRRNGNTFAYCIRLLLEDRNKIRKENLRKYIDEEHGASYPWWFSREVLKINEMLERNGFETNLIK